MELNNKIDMLKDQLIEDVQSVLRIKSVQENPLPSMPFGKGVNDALNQALSIGDKLGFKTKNIDGYMGCIEWGEGDEIVGVLGHLDVVPEGDGWNYAPYGAEIHDGKIYARGALDDKGPIIASLYGLYALKETGFAPKKRIRILLGTNEETGSQDVQYYLKHEEAPTLGFTPDADFPVIFAEKGLTVFNLVKNFTTTEKGEIKYIRGGQRPNMVPDYCEVGITANNKDEIISNLVSFGKESNFEVSYEIKEDLINLKFVGLSAHGSTPEVGKNAIMAAIMFLDKYNVVSGEKGNAIKFLSRYIGMETKGESLNINLHDDASGYLSFNVGTILLEDNKLTLGLNLRYPVTYTLDDMMKPFEEKIKAVGFEVEDFEHQAPLYFPKDHKLIETLLKVYEDQTGRKEEPIAIGGGTYAKEIPNTVAFGPLFPGKADIAHQANEYIEIEDLMLITKIYANAIKELANN